MTHPKKFGALKRLGILAVALAGSFFTGSAIAEDKVPENPVEPAITLRTREEATQINKNAIYKTTLGLSKNSGAEFLRAYGYTGKDSTGKDIDYTSLGFSTSPITLGETSHTFAGLGNFGDRTGGAVETSHKWKGLEFGLNFDWLESKVKEGHREGAGVKWTITDKTTIGAGFDTLTTNHITTNHYFANFVNNLTTRDQVGFGTRLVDNEGAPSETFSGYWMRHGKGEDFGGRLYGRYDHFGGSLYGGKKPIEAHCFSFEGIFAQKPTFIGPLHGPALVGRSSVGGELLSTSLVESSLGVERTPRPCRTMEGLVAAISGNLRLEGGDLIGSPEAEIAYRLLFPGGGFVAPSILYNHQFARKGNGDTDNAGGAIMVGWKNLCIEWRVKQKIDNFHESHPELYGSITYAFRF